MKLSVPAWDGMKLEEARGLFQRVLACWASDMLRLRREGLDRPSVRRGSGVWGAGEAFGGGPSAGRKAGDAGIRQRRAA